MLNQRFSIVILLTIMTMTVAAAVITYGILPGSRTLSSNGQVTLIAVGVYSDEACTENVTEINWGLVEPGSAHNCTVFIKNEGTAPMILNMTVDSWSPVSTLDYITLGWNVEGSTVNEEAVLETIITLTVSPDISGIADFTIEITIKGI